MVGPTESVPGRDPWKVTIGTAMVVSMIVGAVVFDHSIIVSVVAAFLFGLAARAIGVAVWTFASRGDTLDYSE